MNVFEYIEEKIKYNNNYDVVKRVINEHTLYFLSSLADMKYVNEIILGIQLNKSLLLNGSISYVKKLDEAITMLLSGCTLVIVNEKMYLIETRNYPNRSISESFTEKSIKGVHDGFNESILTNTALIRRRINDCNLCCELFKIGKNNKIDISINYLKGKVDEKLLVNIKKKLKAYNQDYVVNSNKSLIDYLCNSKFSIFPKVRYSERPDVASINILKGYIVLLIDTSSCCIILPTSIFELNEQLDEYHLSPFVTSFIRIIKYLLMVLALYILPVWFLLCVNKNEINNQFIILSNIKPSSLFFQLLSIQIFIYAIRLASYNTSSIFSTSFSIFASIVISSLSIETGLLDKEVVFYGAFSSICCYSISSYETSQAISVWSIILLIGVYLFNVIGLIILNTILFLSLVTSNNYLYPFIPFDINKLVNKIFKLNNNKK